MIRRIKILTLTGSLASIGFGIWHFFVPSIWNWYAYIDPSATELVLAVRAINLFFSLSLVLFGVANVLVVYKAPQERFSLMVLLAASSVLWATRSVWQLLYPQGTFHAEVQYGLLSIFILVFFCFAFSLWLVAKMPSTRRGMSSPRQHIPFPR